MGRLAAWGAVAAVLATGCPSEEPYTIDPPPGAIAVEPQQIDLGDVPFGEQRTAEILVASVGNGPLNWAVPTLDGEGSFTLDTGAHVSPLDMDQATALWVTFAPPGHEVSEATVDIRSDDPDRPSIAVTVTGRGIAPAIRIDPADWTFEDCEVGSDQSVDVQLMSVGSADLVLDDLVFETPYETLFTAYGPGGNQPMTPGDEFLVTVIYQPASDVAFDAVLTAGSNDPLRPEATATFSAAAHWAPAITDTHVQAGDEDTFDLSQSPVEHTLEVAVEGAPATVGWAYHAGPNAIVFDPGHVPLAGQEIQISYHPVGSC